MIVYFQSIGISQDLLNSVTMNNELNPYKIFYKSQTLNLFVNKKKGQKFLSAYKRIDSILKNFSSKNNIKKSKFCESYEKDLYDKTGDIRTKINKLNLNENFDEALNYICELTPVINFFFDNVTVNIDDKFKKGNRLALLNFTKKTLNQLCDFSKFKENYE